MLKKLSEVGHVTYYNGSESMIYVNHDVSNNSSYDLTKPLKED